MTMTDVHQCFMAVLLGLCITATQTPADDAAGLIKPGAKVKELASGFRFTEGPALAANGDVYFTDVPYSRIHRWSVAAQKLSTFLEDSGGANGLFFAANGDLYACQGEARRVAAIDQQGKVTVLADRYQGKRFNKPNDLWIDPKGGVYFTDPGYGRKPSDFEQDGEHVYYIAPDRKQVIRVIDDFQRPNGIIGTADGKTLYVTDRSAYKTWVYDINRDATLSHKRLFCDEGSDGMTLDERGNLYLTPKELAVHVYSPTGKLIGQLALPAQPANLVFGGPDRQTLFITARQWLYAVKMQVHGQ